MIDEGRDDGVVDANLKVDAIVRQCANNLCKRSELDFDDLVRSGSSPTLRVPKENALEPFAANGSQPELNVGKHDQRDFILDEEREEGASRNHASQVQAVAASRERSAQQRSELLEFSAIKNSSRPVDLQTNITQTAKIDLVKGAEEESRAAQAALPCDHITSSDTRNAAADKPSAGPMS